MRNTTNIDNFYLSTKPNRFRGKKSTLMKKLLLLSFSLSLFIGNSLIAQTNIVDCFGDSYNNTDALIPITEGQGIDISNCTSWQFTGSWDTNGADWVGSGSNNFEAADECNIGSPCAGDPLDPSGPGCGTCWDFLYIDIATNLGTIGFTELIGLDTGSPTSDSWDTGVQCVADGENTLDLNISLQNWASDETWNLTCLTVICWEAIPTATLTPDPACEGNKLNLNGTAIDEAAVGSWAWTPADDGGLQNDCDSSPLPGTPIYTLEVTDDNGCTASTEVMATVNPSPMPCDGDVSYCSADEACVDLTAFDAAVDCNGEGFTVLWYDGDPDAGTGIVFADPTCADMTGVTDLYAQADDGSGCMAAILQTVTVVTLTATADITETSGTADDYIVCEGEDFDLLETEGLGDTYDWMGPDGTTASGTPSPITSTAGHTGIWTVTVTDSGSGCTATSEISVTITPAPTAAPTVAETSALVDDDGTVCEGDPFDLTADETDVSGTGVTIEWFDPSSNSVGGDPAMIAAADGSHDGTWTVVVTDDVSGCTGTATIDIIVSAPPVPIDPNIMVCAAAAMMYDLTTEDLNVGIGTVAWYDGDPTGGGGTLIDPATNVDISGGIDLWAEETNADGCSAVVQVTVTLTAGPTTQTTTLTGCDDGTGNGLFTLEDSADPGAASNTGGGDVDDGAGGMTLLFFDNLTDAEDGTQTMGNIASPYASPGGSVWVRVTDADGCFSVVEITLVLAPAPIPAISGLLTVCEGDPITLTENNDGSPGYTWSWDTPSGPYTTAIVNIDPSTPGDAGTYTVTVTDDNGCTATFEVVVNIDPASPLDVDILETITNTADNTDGIVCDGDEIDLSELSGLDVEWLLPDGTNFTTDDDPMPFIADATIHAGVWTVQLEGGGGSGCASSSMFTITVNPPPVPLPNILAQCDLGELTLEETSGSGTVDWYIPGNAPPAASDGVGSPFTINPADAATHNGDWTVMVTDANGCTGTEIITVTLGPAPSVTPTENGPLCAGQDLILDETFGDGVSWSWDGPNGNIETDDPTSDATVTGVTVADAGVYTVTVTDINGCTNTGEVTVAITGSGIANDDCSAPDPWVVSVPCMAVNVGGDTSGACPETSDLSSGCGFDLQATTWYQFTTLGATTSVEITNVTGGIEYAIFDAGCPPSTIFSGCEAGDFTFAATASTTYYVAVTVPGAEGAFTLDISFLEAPANDICGSAEVLGTTASGNNACASADAALCGATDHVVYYAYTITSTPNASVDITLASTGIVSPSFALWVGCSGTPADGQESCGTDGTLSLTCVPTGTEIIIPVGSAMGDAGSFDITVTETPGGGGAPNDDCSTAELIPAAACVVSSVTGDTTGACPELANGDCMQSTDPTVWYTFTTPPGTTALDFTNVSGVSLQVITDCPATTSTGPCITGDTNLPTGDGTFWLSATTPGGEASFSFDINFIAGPANDMCADAFVGSGGGTTCCASPDGYGCTNNNTVWHVYSIMDPSATVTVDVANVSIGGTMGVDIYIGDCTAATNVIANCLAGSNTYDIPCPGPGEVYVQISTLDESGCGEYTVTFSEEPPACSLGAACGSDYQLAPSTNSGAACQTACNDGICDAAPCAGIGMVWFEVTTDALASALIIDVNDPDFTPAITVLELDCSGNALVACSSGTSEVVAVAANFVYYIGISSNDGSTGNFELCVTSIQDFADCGTSDITIIRPEYPGLDEEGPYCVGEKITVCVDVTWNIDDPGVGNNCQWLQGIVPALGGGWDLDACPLPAGIDQGGTYFGDGEVSYTAGTSIYGLTTNCQGIPTLEVGGGVGQGTPLPGGWYFTSPGSGPDCSNDGNPNTMWGLNGGCGSTSAVSFCFDLQTRIPDDAMDCQDPCFGDLDISMFTFADGQTGCWSQNSCAADVPSEFLDGELDCSGLVEVEGPEEAEICSGDMLDLDYIATDGISDILIQFNDNPNVTGEVGPITWPGGNASINDVLINNGTTSEIVEYTLQAINPNSTSGCNGPPLIVEITVHPEIVIEFDEPYDVCWDGQITITPMVTGGQGGPYSYDWDNGDTGPSTMAPQIIGDPPGTYTYVVTVTDDLGCTNSESVEYTIQPQEIISHSQTADAACQDDFDDEAEICLLISPNQNGPFTFDWTYPPGLIVDENDECVVIDDEASLEGEYELSVVVTDSYGCEYQYSGIFFDIDIGPVVNLSPIFCTGDLEYSIELCDSNGGTPEWILYDEFYAAQLDGPLSGNCVTFTVTPFAPGDDVPVTFGVIASDPDSGCSSSFDVELIPPAIPEFIFDDEGCEGETITVTLDNWDLFQDVTWCDGTFQDQYTVTLGSDDHICTIEFIDFTGCIFYEEIEILVDGGVEAQISGSLSFCATGSTTLSTIDDPSYDYLWSNGDTGNSITVNTAGIYTVTVSSGDCSATDEVTVSVGTELQPTVNGEDFCEGDMTTIITGETFLTYDWTDPSGAAVTSMAGMPWIISVGTPGTYMVEVSDGSCSGTGTITVNEITGPSAMITPPTANPCNDPVGGPTTVDLTLLVTGATGPVTYIDENGVTINTPTSVDFANYTPGAYTLMVVIPGVAPCTDFTAPIVITVDDCACPGVLFNNIGDFCNDQTVTRDLSNFLLATTDPGGTFTVEDAAGNPAANQPAGTMLTIDNSWSDGTYTLVYTLANVPTNCPDFHEETFTIYGAPDATLTQNGETVCNTTDSGGETTVNLDLYVNYSGIGVWQDATGVPVPTPNAIDFAGMPIGTSVTYFYVTTDATDPPCSNLSLPFNVTVVDCDCPFIGLTPIPDELCDTDAVVDLNPFLTTGTETGFWQSETSGWTLPGSGIFDPEDLDAGTYVFSYNLNAPLPNCDSTAVDSIIIFEAPVLPILQDTFLCGSVLNPVFPTSIDLTGLEPVGFSGSWSAPNNYNGGVIPDLTNVMFLDTMPGIFVFTYTTDSAMGPCADDSVNLIINVQNCDCPIIQLIPVVEACVTDTDASIDLSELELPLNPDGSWSYGSGPLTNVTLTDNTFDASGQPAGEYIFIFTLDAPVTGCEEIDSVRVFLYEPYLIPSDFPSDLEACSVTSNQGTTTYNLDELVIDVPGSWDVPNNYPNPITDFSVVDFEGLTPGTSYDFTYTTSNSGTCPGESATVTITVIDCDCPNVFLGDAPDLCTDGDSFEIDLVLSTGIVDGTLTFEDANGNEITLNNGFIEADQLTEGTYVIIFTPDDALPAECPQGDTTLVNILDPPNPGTGAELLFCAGEDDFVDFAVVGTDTGASSGGTWVETSTTPSLGGLDPITNIFQTQDEAPGIYTFEYFFDTSNTPCDPVSSVVTVEIEELPSADAGVGGTLDCDNNFVVVGGSGSSTGNDFEYIWINPAGDTLYQGSELAFDANAEGEWTLTVVNIISGCSSTATTLIDVDGVLPSFLFASSDAPCNEANGDNTGSITITNSTGTPPYLFSLNGGEFQSVDEWTQLDPDTYTITMLDGDGCQSPPASIIIAEPGAITYEIGGDLTVEVGETVLLSGPDFDSLNVATLTWTQDGEIICSSPPDGECAQFEVEPPLIPTTYCLEVITEEGCIAVSCRSLQALAVRDVYLPNVISSWNGEAETNTKFYVHADEFVESIPLLSIYDRWGELVFTFENGEPNNPDHGWDGTFNEVQVEQGVYVYLIDLEYVGGDREIFTGSITVTR